MKQLNITLEDEEHKILEFAKDMLRMNWREYVLYLYKKSQEEIKNG